MSCNIHFAYICNELLASTTSCRYPVPDRVAEAGGRPRGAVAHTRGVATCYGVCAHFDISAALFFYVCHEHFLFDKQRISTASVKIFVAQHRLSQTAGTIPGRLHWDSESETSTF